MRMFLFSICFALVLAMPGCSEEPKQKPLTEKEQRDEFFKQKRAPSTLGK